MARQTKDGLVYDSGEIQDLLDSIKHLTAENTHLRAVHMAADKVFVGHGVGLDTDRQWAILSDALDTVNIAAVTDEHVTDKHASDCAVHNASSGLCDCSLSLFNRNMIED